MEILRGMFRKMFPRHGLGTRRVLPYSILDRKSSSITVDRRGYVRSVIEVGDQVLNSPLGAGTIVSIAEDGTPYVLVTVKGEPTTLGAKWAVTRYGIYDPHGMMPKDTVHAFKSTGLFDALRELFFHNRSK